MDWLQAHLDEIVTYALAAIGLATAIIKALEVAIVPLRDYAKLTANATDDRFVEQLARFTATASQVVLAIGQLVAPLALKKPSRTFPPPPLDVRVHVDEDADTLPRSKP